MHLSKGTKYIAANVGLVVLAFGAIQYFVRANGPHPASGRAALAIGGLGLYVLASTVIILRAYYRNGRFDFLDKTPLHTAVATEALLGADRLKPVTLTLNVSTATYRALADTGTVTFRPDVFHTPIRSGDTVRIRCDDAAQTNLLVATITDIDGYNQRVTLQLAR